MKRYFVDNINGDAGNDGLSWNTAFAWVSTAITAWEAYRATLANIYARGANLRAWHRHWSIWC